MASKIYAYPLRNENNEIIMDDEGYISFVPMGDGANFKLLRILMSSLDASAAVTTVVVNDQLVDCLVSAQAVEAALNRAEQVQQEQPVQQTPPVLPVQQCEEGEEEPPAEFCWDDSAMKLFFSEYQNKKKLLDKRVIKTHKMMYMAIADEMKNLGHHVTWNQVENKYKLLSKTMKLYINRSFKKNSSGRGRKPLPYEKEMTDMFAKRHNIVPAFISGRNGPRTREEMLAEAGFMLPGEVTDAGSSIVSQPPPISSPLCTILTSSDSTSASTSASISASTSASMPATTSATTPASTHKKVRARDGKTAMSLNALREVIAQQNLGMEDERERRSSVQGEMLSLLRDFVKEQKRANDLREMAVKQRQQRNVLLKEQLAVLRRLAPDTSASCYYPPPADVVTSSDEEMFQQ